jgi:septal ring-binding cell division protein DamX
MPIRRKQAGVRDRVLESRHVIGLFVLILLFSGLFFALGFVMGKNQYDGKVLADRLPKNGVSDAFETPKPLPGKHGNGNVDGVSKTPLEPVSSIPKPQNPVWDTHDFDSAPRTSDRLQPASPSPAASQKNPTASLKNTAVAVGPRGRLTGAPFIPSGAYTLQVAALKNQADALDLALRLQKQKYPAFVLSPQSDKFYRVQVGPYPDQKTADLAKKGLDGAGFKAIVKH